MSEILLSVKDLTTSFTTDGGKVSAVKGISFDIKKGETLGIPKRNFKNFVGITWE